jgi:hypothetical protein
MLTLVIVAALIPYEAPAPGGVLTANWGQGSACAGSGSYKPEGGGVEAEANWRRHWQ